MPRPYHRNEEPPDYIVNLIPGLTAERAPIYPTLTVSFEIIHDGRLDIYVVGENDYLINHREIQLPECKFIQWHAMLTALEFAAEVQDTHGTYNLVLESSLPALQMIAKYCRRVAFIKRIAIRRGHNERGYSYSKAEAVLEGRMEYKSFELVWHEIWRLIVGRWNDRIEFREVG